MTATVEYFLGAYHIVLVNKAKVTIIFTSGDKTVAVMALEAVNAALAEVSHD